MDIPDRLIELQTAADAEHAKLTGLTGHEHATQWIERTVACLAAISP
ncbi:hypothetical protein [Streptomyces sp. DASNCL29]|nr:hypothetical protein [Streptomyces sp. DASNCL29]